jgi:hypothetical protein
VALRKTRQLKTRTTAKLTRLLHELSFLARTKNHDLQKRSLKILTLFLPSYLLKKDELTLTNVSTGFRQAQPTLDNQTTAKRENILC